MVRHHMLFYHVLSDGFWMVKNRAFAFLPGFFVLLERLSINHYKNYFLHDSKKILSIKMEVYLIIHD